MDQPEIDRSYSLVPFVMMKLLQSWDILGDQLKGSRRRCKGGAEGFEEPDQWNAKLPRVMGFHLHPKRKRMSTIVKIRLKLCSAKRAFWRLPIYCFQGFSELILERWHSKFQWANPVMLLNDTARAKILDHNNQLAANGLRVLGLPIAH
jgi:Ca2+-transporting ATPase